MLSITQNTARQREILREKILQVFTEAICFLGMPDYF